MRRATAVLLPLVALMVAAPVLMPGAVVRAQAPALPDAAQLAFERGLAAAQQQDWKLAVQYFTQAERSAGGPGDSGKFPQLLFNLGLAHARAGNDLPAMAWLMAYLDAVPSASNAAQVRAEIVRLDVAVESKIRKILQEAAAIARRLPEMDRRLRLSSIAQAQSMVGDIEGALASQAASGFRDEAIRWVQYAARLAEDGRITEAEQVFAQWAGRVDAQGPLGPLNKSSVDSARRSIALRKEQGSLLRHPYSVARGLSLDDPRLPGSGEILRLDVLLREASGREPEAAANALMWIATTLDSRFKEARDAWRAHPARASSPATRP